VSAFSGSTIERHHLLAAVPASWEQKFKEELTQSPLLQLVALKVSQHIVDTYRQRLEMALRSGEVAAHMIRSPYIKVKSSKKSAPSISISIPKQSRNRALAEAKQEIETTLSQLNFWESSASYMWFDLTRMAFTEMEQSISPEQWERLTVEESLTTLYHHIFDEASDSLKSNFSTVLQSYVDQAVQLVLTQHDLSNKSLQELEHLAGLESEHLPLSPLPHPRLFASANTSNFATCKLLWESVNILTQRTDLKWQPDSDGKLAYTSNFKDDRGRLIFWVTDHPEEQYPEALAGEAALAVIETFDIRAACMHLIYAAHVTTLERPWEEEFVLDDTHIASYLGLDKRKDLTKENRLKLIERIAEQPAQILTFLHWPQQGNIESFYVEKSRLWEVAIGYHGQRDIFDQIQCTGLTIRCRAGMWAKYFLNKRGADEGKAFYQYGVLSKTLLQTITRVWQHSEGAARMLAWLSFKMRVSNNSVMLTPTLMEVAYGQAKLYAAQHDRDLRSELVSTWDNDLRVLCEAGFKIEFDPVSYPAEIQPDWYEGGRGSKKRPRGFWDILCNSRLHIHPPAEIADGIAKLHRRKAAIDVTAQPTQRRQIQRNVSVLTGSIVKAAREAKGWTQAELGEQIGRTKMWVSLIERDQRSIKPEDATHLKSLLALDEYLVNTPDSDL
jgi:DNA-binding XRE family transcriptional regulator